MTATLTMELHTACENYLSAVQKERALVAREEQLLQKYGKAHAREVQLGSALSHLWPGESLVDDMTDAILELSSRQKESDLQKTMCSVLWNALEAVRKERQSAAEETAQTFSSLSKQARLDLNNRWGKTPARFGFWSDAHETEFAWRGPILASLLAKVQSGRSEDMELLRLFFMGATFRLVALRGFYVRTDAGMKDIHPRHDGEGYSVPGEVPFDLAFSRLASGQAVVCP